MTMPFWSISFDYYATGEGWTMGAMYVQATDKDLALSKAMLVFDEFWVKQATVEPGIKIHGIFEMLAPKYVRDHFINMDSGKSVPGKLEWHTQYHCNLN
jgi:hypothetical protein